MEKEAYRIRDVELPWVRVQLTTSSLEQSKMFEELWNGVYEMIKAMVEGEEELNDGAAFLESIKIETKTHENKF